MKRFLGFALAMFFALMAIALVGGDNGAVAGHGCHGRERCHGHRERCHGKHRRCHGEVAQCCGETSDCSGCASGCAGGDCGGAAVIESEGVPTEAAKSPAEST